MADELEQYIRIEKSKARLAGNPISDEEARRRAEARQKGATINLATGEISYTQRPTTTRPKTPGAGFPRVTADTAERRAQQSAPTTTTGAPTSNRPTRFPSVTADTAERSQGRNQDILGNEETVTSPSYPDKNNVRAKDALIREYISLGYDEESANELAGIVSQDITPDVAYDRWVTSDVYKRKFGWINEARKKANPNAIDMSSGEIINYYNNIRDLAKSSGLPSTFWDNNNFATKALANDMSPTEVSERVKIAADFVNNQDEYFKQAARELGIPLSDLVAYSLDPELGLPAIQRDYRASQLLSETKRAQISVGKEFIYEMESAGVSQGVARQAAADVSTYQPTQELLTGIEGIEKATTEELLGAEVGINTAEAERQKRLKSRERARFSQSGGGTRMFGPDLSASY